MHNTFWTLIENDYYRVHNKILKHAPINKKTNTIDLSKKSVVEVISAQKLELVNKNLGSSFMIENF